MVTAESLRADLESYLAPLLNDYRNRLGRYRELKIVRDVIWGFHVFKPYEWALIDSPPFQRLRNIFQTSLAFLTYPCSVHSRFEHSLGAATVAARMLAAIELRWNDLEPTLTMETKLAALLHDLCHGPFSHSSEKYYEQLRTTEGTLIFEEIKKSQPLFAGASASEIMTHLMLTTHSFRGLWEQIKDMYKETPILKSVRLDRIANMIIGVDAEIGDDVRFHRQIVNGPFDADKLDYLPRDGYFTGLNIVVDIERLLHTVTVTGDAGIREIGVVASGASVLEQVIFAKTQLYSSVYNHHKVRAAHQLLIQLFQLMAKKQYKPGGRDLRDPVSYAVLDDYDLLHAVTEDKEINEHVQKIKQRVLPKRALIISYPCFQDDESRENFNNLDKAALSDIESEISSQLRLRDEEVILDLPESPRLGGTGQALVQIGSTSKDSLPLQEIYPAGAWAKAYAGYRKIAYLFTTAGDRRAVGMRAKEILASRKYPIRLNENALTLAKIG